jgi:hypothetical protein
VISTLTRGLRQRNVDTNDLTYWANKELIPLLAQVVQALSYISRVQATISTAGTSTFTTIWSSADIPVGGVLRLDVHVIGADSGNRAAFEKIGLFFNDGTTAQEGVTATIWSENGPGYGVQFLIVSNHIDLQVADAGASTSWTAVIDAQELNQ